MPPRKSNLSQTATTGDEGTPSKDKERDGVNIEVNDNFLVSIAQSQLSSCLQSAFVAMATFLTSPQQDLALPRTMVQRLAKGVIPANTQIQKDAITAMSKSATLFVNYLAHAYVNSLSHFP